jgi:hypothetical protein
VTEYNNTAQIVSGGISFHPQPALSLSLHGDYVMSSAEFDPVIMPTVSDDIYANIPFGDYDYSGIHEYSNLDYEQLNIALDGSYQFSPRMSFNAGISYYDLTDNEGYVYGVESGSLFVVRAGVTITGM